LCLRWGAELNSQNAQGQTALHYCFAYHYDELGAYLIEKGASDSITNYFGWTCYDGLRPDDAQEALFLLRQHLGPQASMDIISGGTMQPPPAQGE
jgi:ankyrin repeat protein